MAGPRWCDCEFVLSVLPRQTEPASPVASQWSPVAGVLSVHIQKKTKNEKPKRKHTNERSRDRHIFRSIHLFIHVHQYIPIQVIAKKKKKHYQSRFTVRRLCKADNCGFGCGRAGGCSDGGGERRSQHHSSECCGCCGCRLRQQALLDEGLWIWGHLAQRWKTSLQSEWMKCVCIQFIMWMSQLVVVIVLGSWPEYSLKREAFTWISKEYNRKKSNRSSS